MEKHTFDKVDGEVIAHEVIPMVVEKIGYQYGSEVFDSFEKNQENMVVSQILDLEPKKESMGR